VHFNPPNEIKGPPGIRILNPVTSHPEQQPGYQSHDLQTLAATAAAAGQYQHHDQNYPPQPQNDYYPTYAEDAEKEKPVTQSGNNPDLSSLLNPAKPPASASTIDPNLEAPAEPGKGFQWVNENEQRYQGYMDASGPS
jgi:hypothetical protein